MPVKKSQDEVINNFKKIHGDKYDYSLVKYENNRTKIIIICPIHGKFTQSPNKHLMGRNCPKCGINEKSKKLLSNNIQFIEKSIKVHGDRYDYSLVEYINSSTKIKIICPIHGIFEQVPKYHTSGNGCQKCCNTTRLTKNIFIKKSKEIHGDKYDYSLVEYKNNKTKVKIICKLHGEFEQRPDIHLSQKQGCPECSLVRSRYSIKDFIDKANDIHDNRYDYSLVVYKNARTNVKIICPIHGIFEQNSHTHLRGSGCPICGESKGEKNIRKILQKNKIDFEIQKSFENCKFINNLFFDFYIPSRNICIEFDGKQHFEPNNFFGGVDVFKNIQRRDQIKNEYCHNNNIRLYRIRYDEDVNLRMVEIIKNLI